MIRVAERIHLEDIARVISDSVTQCIKAQESELKAIIEDSIASSTAFIHDGQQGVHLVYQSLGTVVGIVLIHDYWNMKSLFVLPACHRQGVASALVEAALAICKSNNPDGVVKLHSSTCATAFYENAGFNPHGTPRDLPGGCIPFKYRL
ncbi:GNAT family N-acetyltransferase [Salinimonas lutimaris]|uniref:GNAT family N-acetyltransferase n=1 Tax=Salinimonas lutimaris TaxID=914153 RepID=UPI001585EA8C|nr:GNAT family N-acetyltransferase [Salinimonas lutimaris]